MFILHVLYLFCVPLNITDPSLLFEAVGSYCFIDGLSRHKQAEPAHGREKHIHNPIRLERGTSKMHCQHLLTVCLTLFCWIFRKYLSLFSCITTRLPPFFLSLSANNRTLCGFVWWKACSGPLAHRLIDK